MEQITLDYSNYEKKNEIIKIYTKFEIIEQNLMQLFIWKFKNNNILSECFLTNGFIIINLPNHLNKNIFISLIGNLDKQNHLIIKFIFSYHNEKERKKTNRYQLKKSISKKLVIFIF